MMRSFDYISMVAIPISPSDPHPRRCLVVAMIQSRNCCIVVSNSGYSCIFYRYVETAFAQKVNELPTRYLPPGSIKMLYHEFALRYPTVSYLEQALVGMVLIHGLRSLPVSSCLSGLKNSTYPRFRYGTFWRRFVSVWKNTLRFTPASDHSTCDTCLDLKERFKKAFEARQ